MRYLFLGCCLATAALAGAMESSGGGQASTDTRPEPAKAVDNTAQNKRDGAATTPTAQDQGFDDADRKVLQGVRRNLIADKDLSLDAHNLKVVVHDGRATLRGPVKDAAERERVGEIVKQSPGITAVDNQAECKATDAAR